jgi:hypothetical protein
VTGRRRTVWRSALVAAVLAGATVVLLTVGGAGRSTARVPWEVPDDVTTMLESIRGDDDLRPVLAAEAADLPEAAGALPEGSTIRVRPGTWSEVGATASVAVEVTPPDGAPPVAFVVLLARDEREERDEGNEGDEDGGDGWLIAGTFAMEQP